MKKIPYQERRKIEDSLWRETMSERMVKNVLMQKYRYPARLARTATKQLLKDAIQYWMYEDVY